MLLILVSMIIMYITFDVNYFVRTFFVALTSGVQRKYSLGEVTTIYGIGTFQDSDVFLKYVNLARLIRELDFARYHFYYRTGIYNELKNRLKLKFLQGSTFTLTLEPVPLFSVYKINTKLVFWDEISMFFEHEVVTLYDGRVRCYLISRQHVIGDSGGSTASLLSGLPGAEHRLECPEHVAVWLESMRVSSHKLRWKKGLKNVEEKNTNKIHT